MFNYDLNFGSYFVWNTSTRHITISNPWIVPATVLFDLSDNKNFKIEYSQKLYTQNSDKNSIILLSYPRNDPEERLYQF